MTSKLEHALALATKGFYIFPCEANGKLPTLPWRERSTINPETIKSWFVCDITGWEQDYNIGIDCAKSGLTVVDVDTKPGKEGKKTYETFDAENGWPETFTVKTPSGGLHLYYLGGGFRNTQGDKGGIGPGIDTRSEGGFVVAPGSAIAEKEYKVIRDKKIVPVPEWLKEKLQSHRSDLLTPRDSGKTIIADDEGDISAAIEFLQNHDPAVEGHGGDHHTYVTFCMLKERGLSIEKAIELAEEYWNPNCTPPWDHEDLIAKANSAYKSAHNATGAKSPHAEFDIPKESPASKIAIPANFDTGSLLADANSFPPRDWVFGKIALAKNVTLVIAPAGVGKSTLTLAIALSKISGKKILDIDPLERGAVAIFNNEDTKEEQMRRLVAAAQHYGITNDQLLYPDVTGKGSMLFLNGRENGLLRIAKRLSDGRIKADQADGLAAYLIEHQVRLLIVDPLSMTHPAAENSNEEMLIVGSIYAAVADKANCSVVLVHHTRKADQASSEGHSGNLDSARGASSLGGVARIAYTLNVMSRQDALCYGVPEREKSKYLLLEQAKANMSAPGEHRLFYERHGEVIGINADNIDGESVGVLRPANFKDKRAEDTSPEMQVLIQDIEELVEDQMMTIPEIARALISSFPLHGDKKERSLEKAINRMFSEGVLTGFKGVLFVEEKLDIGAKKPTRYIRLSLNETADTTDSLI